MNCPICDYKGLGEDAMNCPSCNADLSAFRALDDVELSMQKQKKRTLLFIILFFLAFMGCFVVYFIMSSTEPAKEDNYELAVSETQLEYIRAENEQLKSTNEALLAEQKELRQELTELKKPVSVTHVVKDGESLYYIARIYLGNGELYPKIAEDNGIENPDIIITGTELIINK